MSNRPSCGLIALGDSITNGHGDQVLGVHCQSWAQWLAEALEMPFTKLAVDGQTAPGLVRGELPRLRDGYEIGALYIGVNDVRSLDWDAEAYAGALELTLTALTASAARVVVCTVPVDLGRPRAGGKVGAANAIVRAAATRHGAAVAGLDDLHGWPLVLPDVVHPTAVGHLVIADRAAAAIEAPVRPSSLVEVRHSRRALLHCAVTRRAPAVARDAGRRVVERVQRERRVNGL